MLQRRLSLLEAVSLNMSLMVGIGPFITIPTLVGTLGGPQAMLGWILGAAVALADGMVWSELAAAFPGSGGTYHFYDAALGESTARPFAQVRLRLAVPVQRTTGDRHRCDWHDPVPGVFLPEPRRGRLELEPVHPFSRCRSDSIATDRHGTHGSRHDPGLSQNCCGRPRDGRLLGRDAGHGRLGDHHGLDPF